MADGFLLWTHNRAVVGAIPTKVVPILQGLFEIL